MGTLNLIAFIACTISAICVGIKGYIWLAVIEAVFAVFNVPFIIMWIKGEIR